MIWILPQCAHADVKRFGIIIGSNVGGDDEGRLAYAERDALRMYEVLHSLGDFASERLVLLTGKDPHVLKSTLDELKFSIQRVHESGDEAIVLLYFSGHADSSSLHFGNEFVPLKELHASLQATKAGLRIVIIDACRKLPMTRRKGGVVVPAFSWPMNRGLPGKGDIFLHATTVGEDAQESDKLQGSFFTHYLVSGLVGAADSDRDGKIVLDEAFRYARTRTLQASSLSQLGPQRPTYAYEIHGRKDLVLTQLGHRDQNAPVGSLGIPSEFDALVFGGQRDDQVFAEISYADRSRTMHLPPGRYLVRLMSQQGIYEGKVVLTAGEFHNVKLRELHRRDPQIVVRKGQKEARIAHGPLAAYRLRSPLWPKASLCHGVDAGYALHFRNLSFLGFAGYCRSQFEGSRYSIRSDDVDFTLHAARALDYRSLTFMFGIHSGLVLLSQHLFDTNDSQLRRSLAAQAGLSVHINWRLRYGWAIAAWFDAQMLFFREQENKEESIQTAFVARPHLGVAKVF